MGLDIVFVALLANILVGHSLAAPRPLACAAGACFAQASFPPAFTPIASTFCELYIRKTPGTVTQTVTATSTSTTTLARSTITSSVVATFTSTLATTCSTTTTVPTAFTTSVGYPARQSGILRRGTTSLAIPSELSHGCTGSIPQQISSACSCFLQPKTTTKTVTTIVTATAPTLSPTITSIVHLTTVQTTICTSTSTSTVTAFSGPLICGVSNPSTTTSGDITCTAPPPGGQTNGRLRIEGSDNEGTIFESCISSGPSVVTTPSGGTHECDGTNDDANPNPGATCTTQLNAASEQYNFPFDATYSTQFQDFFPTSIDQSAQTSTVFWGLLQDLNFTPLGGCQQEIQPGGTQETLWAYNAFNADYFLHIEPEYQVVYAGAGSVQITVTGTEGNGGSVIPITGATIEGSGGTTAADGTADIAVPPVPGCYLFKATRSDSLRSNAFYLTVLPASS